MHPANRIFAIAVMAILAAANAGAAESAEARFIALGDSQWTGGKPDDARKSFEQAIATQPGSVEAHMKLGGLLLATRQYPAAVQTYQRSISLQASNTRAWLGLGFAYLHSGQADLSRAAFAEAVRLDPSRRAQLAELLEKPAK